MSTTFNGQLEINHERGVIWFHLSDSEEIKKLQAVTILRICKLPTPIPQLQPGRSLIDITPVEGVVVSY